MGQPAQGQSPYASFLMLLLIIVVFYFFMIRPQMKRQKELRKYREGLQKGDKVITTGGIYGKVDGLKDNYVIVEIDNNVRIKVDKSAILRDSSDIESK
ncbi:MAG: preprotein translocase subunit YajC [Bacteroidetes bacterium GWC2_33_15]|nr:MAG: preprotein translocase subunit YajC [Bacteroidetes bacterium GWA2_33_15]OFX51114.1 MAG: preprotein translocase subunit YajC [Bacteroidetes bacterium GWC2_33_15]OFX66516.1 MAG: preprotein translocase subunit YajC [Bacteroidetes bacterium GWB2_32_14]OFX70322.1 MAG: preprotein translocase subunit YajC [Bacteroidetes bacterium GWD2_33_33]